jgi:hypothetical protein
LANFEVLVGETVLFRAGSLAALVRLVERESELWKKVFPDGPERFLPSGEQLQPKYPGLLNQLQNMDTTALDISGSQHFEIFPPYESAEGRAIRLVASKKQRKETAALLQYWKIECRWASRHLIEERNEAGREIRAARVTIVAARAVEAEFANNRQMARATEAASKLEGEVVATESAAEAFRQAMEDRSREHTASIDEALKRESRRQRARRKYEKNLAAAWKARFEATHKEYVQKLQFEAPVKLWSTAAQGHKRRARVAFWTFTVLAVLAPCIGLLAITLFGDDIAGAYLPPGCAEGLPNCQSGFSAKGPLLTGAILLAASVTVWLLRTVNRIYISERNLGHSADERRAFAETYLALIKDESVTRDQEAIVMAALFRPSSDGTGGEDNSGIDFSSAAVLAKIMSGRSA